MDSFWLPFLYATLFEEALEEKGVRIQSSMAFFRISFVMTLNCNYSSHTDIMTGICSRATISVE